jgi:hypothetical protein
MTVLSCNFPKGHLVSLTTANGELGWWCSAVVLCYSTTPPHLHIKDRTWGTTDLLRTIRNIGKHTVFSIVPPACSRLLLPVMTVNSSMWARDNSTLGKVIELTMVGHCAFYRYHLITLYVGTRGPLGLVGEWPTNNYIMRRPPLAMRTFHPQQAAIFEEQYIPSRAHISLSDRVLCLLVATLTI